MRKRKAAMVEAADLFCGSGGTSSGLVDACAELGLGLDLVAINHWQVAIDTHSANHPDVKHHCCDLGEVDPREVVRSGKLRLLVASPECTHFSNARGGEPVTNQNRASIKYVLRWLSALDVQDVLIENVPEFRHWGPLHRKGSDAGRPMAKRKGEYFNRFMSKLRAMGYQAEWRILCAADYGDATSRRRLFIRARKGKGPVTWPEPSHAAQTRTLFGELQPYRTARDILKLDRKGESIFNRKKPLSENTMRRIYAGLRKFSGLPFILPNEGIYRGNAPRSVDVPLPTVTAERGAGHVVQPFIVGSGGPKGASGPRPIDEPLRSVLGTSHQALAQPYLVKMYGTSDAAPVDSPVPTITSVHHIGLSQPFLVEFHGGEGAEDRSRPLNRPLPTLTTEPRFGVAMPFLLSMRGGKVGYMRGSSVDEPVPTLTAIPPFYLVQPEVKDFIVQMEHLTEESGDARRVYGTDRPLPTITSKAHFGLAEPFIVKYYGNSDAQSVDQPLGTVTAVERFGLCVPMQDGYAIVDILFRMLDVDELAAAHSQEGYKFQGTKRDIVKQIGNSVPRKLAMALCRAALAN